MVDFVMLTLKSDMITDLKSSLVKKLFFFFFSFFCSIAFKFEEKARALHPSQSIGRTR